MDIFKEFEEEAKKEKNKAVDLGPVSALVKKQAMLERKAVPVCVATLYRFIKEQNFSVSEVEEALKLRKADLNDIKNNQIPELMREYGLSSVTTDDGATIEIKDGLSVTVKDQEKLLAYVREQEAGDLIKNNLTIAIKGEEKTVDHIRDVLNELGVEHNEKEAIHPQTLKKFIKGQLKEGKRPDDNVVNIYEYRYSNIKK
jgi:predicted transcriptional regulator